jgi:hypothetical protein
MLSPQAPRALLSPTWRTNAHSYCCAKSEASRLQPLTRRSAMGRVDRLLHEASSLRTSSSARHACRCPSMRGPRLVSMQWVDSSTVLLPSLCEHDFSPEDEFDTLCYQTPLMYVRMVEHEDSAGQRVTEWLPSSVRVVRFRRPHRRSGHQERLNPTLRPSAGRVLQR